MLATFGPTFRAVLLFLAGVVASPLAAADNVLWLSNTGFENILEIDQGDPDGNRIALDVSGDRNGGAGSDWTRPLPAFMGSLFAGTLAQVGTGNEIMLGVAGAENLFAVVQNGSGNSVRGAVQGTSNMVAIRQSGTGHVAVFRQNGTGNTVAISQSTW